jgi:hypothetical protein
MAETQRFLRGNGLQASAYTPLQLDLHEVPRKGALTGVVLRAAGEDGTRACFLSCTGPRRMLGNTRPMMRTRVGGAHRKEEEVDDVIHGGGQRGRWEAAKPGAKAPAS